MFEGLGETALAYWMNSEDQRADRMAEERLYNAQLAQARLETEAQQARTDTQRIAAEAKQKQLYNNIAIAFGGLLAVLLVVRATQKRG